MSKNIKTIIAAVLCAASVMSMAACGNTESGSTDTAKTADTTTAAAEESKAEETTAAAGEDKPEETTAVDDGNAETTAVSEESQAEGSAAAAPAGSEDMFLDPKAPQKVGEWIKSGVTNTTSQSVDYIEWRVVSAGEDGSADVEKYNSEGHIWQLTQPDEDFIKYYKVVYEVKYPEDMAVSDSGLYCSDVDLYAENPDGGGFERGGVAYIGLGQCFVVSQDNEKPMPGDTVTYTSVYTMLDNDPDYVFRYSFKDKDDQFKESFSASK